MTTRSLTEISTDATGLVVQYVGNQLDDETIMVSRLCKKFFEAWKYGGFAKFLDDRGIECTEQNYYDQAVCYFDRFNAHFSQLVIDKSKIREGGLTPEINKAKQIHRYLAEKCSISFETIDSNVVTVTARDYIALSGIWYYLTNSSYLVGRGEKKFVHSFDFYKYKNEYQTNYIFNIAVAERTTTVKTKRKYFGDVKSITYNNKIIVKYSFNETLVNYLLDILTERKKIKQNFLKFLVNKKVPLEILSRAFKIDSDFCCKNQLDKRVYDFITFTLKKGYPLCITEEFTKKFYEKDSTKIIVDESKNIETDSYDSLLSEAYQSVSSVHDHITKPKKLRKKREVVKKIFDKKLAGLEIRERRKRVKLLRKEIQASANLYGNTETISTERSSDSSIYSPLSSTD